MALSPLFLFLVVSLGAAPTLGHNDGAPPADCQRDGGVRLEASFRPGLITVDGVSSDWASIPSLTSLPLQAIEPDPDNPYPHGKLSIKVAHDGHDVFFLMEFSGPYEFTQGENHKCPSVALMFGVGDDATYHNMGGCKESPDTCSSVSCNGHTVDIVHFSVGSAIPGRVYGANLIDNANSTGKDSFGHLNDMYAWNPHCRYFDGLFPNGSRIPESGAQNDWRGAWSHSSMDLSYGLIPSDSPYATGGVDGMYVFEFARPLRTSDRLQQDAQFTIGGTHRFIAAFWYPVNQIAWKASGHYSASCDWIPLAILPATSNSVGSKSNISNILSTFTFLLSLGALGLSIAVWWLSRTRKHTQFQALDGDGVELVTGH